MPSIVYDNFTGTNGDLVDSQKWDLVTTGFTSDTVNIQDNALKFSYITGSTKSLTLTSKYILQGDFDIEVTLYTDRPYPQSVIMGVGVVRADGGAGLLGYKREGGVVAFALNSWAGYSQYSYIAVQTFSIRIVKTGNHYAFFRKFNGETVWASCPSGPDRDYATIGIGVDTKIQIYFKANTSTGYFTVDNVILNSGSITSYYPKSLLSNVLITNDLSLNKSLVSYVDINNNLFVELESNRPSTIYYTINGDTPIIRSNVYTSPIEITSTTTLKFFGIDSYGVESNQYTETYVIN